MGVVFVISGVAIHIKRGAVEAAGGEVRMCALIAACRRFLAAEACLADRYFAQLTGEPDATGNLQPMRWVRRFGRSRLELEGNVLPDTDAHLP